MIDSNAVQVADNNPDAMPTFDDAYIRLNSGLSAEQGGDLDPYLRTAIRSFQSDSSLKVYAHSFSYEFAGDHLVVNPERKILVPGFDCMITAFTCDGVDVPTTAYRVGQNWQTGSRIIEPVGLWRIGRMSRVRVEFSAGLSVMPAPLQSILAVRIKYDVSTQPGDLMRYNEERKRYTIGTIVYG